MGLASFLLGDSNPFSQWAAQNSGLLGSVGGGIAQGTNIGQGLSYAAQNVPQGRAVDAQAQQQREAAQKAEALTAQAEALKTKYADFFNQNGQPMYAQAVADGIMEPGAAYGQWMQAQGGAPAQNPYMSAGDGKFFNWQTGQYVNDPNAQPAAPNVPAGYRATPTGSYEAIPGGPADPNNPLNAKKTATGDLSATETRQLFETEDAIQAGQNVVSALDTALSLNDKSRSGWGAELSANIGANMPDWVPLVGGDNTDANTLQLKNIVTEQALSQLKLVFGGNPTEGERQILLDIQGSVNQPADVRKRIFDRAKELALTRIKFNEQRKAKIETGGYGVVNGGQRTGAAYTVIGVE